MKIRKQYYNDTQMTDENSLAKTLLQYPDRLSPILTHLGGREDKKFPLTMFTEGAGNVETVKSQEYEYDVTTRTLEIRPVAETPDSTDNLGIGGSLFTLKFSDKWFIKDYILVSQSGVQAQIKSEPRPAGSLWEYTLQLVNPDPNTVMPAEDVQEGKTFAMLFAAVGVDWSRGNASNWESPARIRHKLGTVRKSYQFSGNAKDYVVEFELPAHGGGTTKRWMDYEEWQKYLQWKMECEMFYWYGEQSYNEQGNTHLKDENGQPVIIPPGILQQIINKESYSRLSTDRLEQIIGDLYYGMTDADNQEVTLYTGIGGAREFDKAMKEHLNNNVYTQFNDRQFVGGSPLSRNMQIGGFFTSYQHVDGHVINVVKVPMFDHSAYAQARAKHPETGYSLESYRMVFVDQSNYDGQPNLSMVHKEGRSMLRWAVSGSVEPKGFETGPSRASDIDGASVHFLKNGGVVLKRFDTSLDLQCVAQ